MGRYAQRRKRGGDAASGAGLPAGPADADWDILFDEDGLQAAWLGDAVPPYEYYTSRWRNPSVSLDWTLSSDTIQVCEPGSDQQAPDSISSDLQADCEIAYCTDAGAVLTQWSAFQFRIP